MKSKSFKKYYLISLTGILAASSYPIYMGAKVLLDMIANGAVVKENYPKYIIPYTPISIAIIAGILLLPLFIKLFKRFALLAGSIASVGVFFAEETLLENLVVISDKETMLVNWQMYSCVYSPSQQLFTDTIVNKTPIDILIGNYNPSFKLHFYIISAVLILTVLNCLYGFAQIIMTGNKKRTKVLVLQSVSTLIFLGLCILACFTSFGRDGNIQVQPITAMLMILFFMILGIITGIFSGSFLLKKRKVFSVLLPALISSVFTALMYIGELILLGGNLYRFGKGMLFDNIFGIAFAPIDIIVILASGCVTALVFGILNKHKKMTG